MRYDDEGSIWEKPKGKNEDGVQIVEQQMVIGTIDDVEIIPLVLLPFYGTYTEAD